MQWMPQLAMIGAIIISTLDYLSMSKPLFNPFYPSKITKVSGTRRQKILCCAVGGAAAYFAANLIMYNQQQSVQIYAAISFTLVPMVHSGRIGKAFEALEHRPKGTRK